MSYQLVIRGESDGEEGEDTQMIDLGNIQIAISSSKKNKGEQLGGNATSVGINSIPHIKSGGIRINGFGGMGKMGLDPMNIRHEKQVYQKNKLYRWEDAKVISKTEKYRWLSQKKLDQFAVILAREYGIAKPDVQMTGSLMESESTPDYIHIGLIHRNVNGLVLMHEFAHAIQMTYQWDIGQTGAHDQFFAGIMINIFARYLEVSEEELIRSARKSGLAVCPYAAWAEAHGAPNHPFPTMYVPEELKQLQNNPASASSSTNVQQPRVFNI